MPAPYSHDLRVRVMDAVRLGMPYDEVIKRYQVSNSTILRWVRRLRETGRYAALPMGGKKPLALLDERDWIVWRLAAKPDQTLHASEQDRPDVARRRARWHHYQGRIDSRRLIFVDETWAKTNMTRLRGWRQRGQRLLDKVPHGHWKTLTLVAALRHDGVIAPCVFDGPINGRSFLAC